MDFNLAEAKERQEKSMTVRTEVYSRIQKNANSQLLAYPFNRQGHDLRSPLDDLSSYLCYYYFVDPGVHSRNTSVAMLDSIRFAEVRLDISFVFSSPISEACVRIA